MATHKFSPNEIVAFDGYMFRVIDCEPIERERFPYRYTLQLLWGEEEITLTEEDLLTKICQT